MLTLAETLPLPKVARLFYEPDTPRVNLGKANRCDEQKRRNYPAPVNVVAVPRRKMKRRGIKEPRATGVMRRIVKERRQAEIRKQIAN